MTKTYATTNFLRCLGLSFALSPLAAGAQTQSQPLTQTAPPDYAAPAVALGPPRPLIGRVRTEDGAPLPGATLLLKGSFVGSSTNSDGQFILNLPPERYAAGGTLNVAFAGFEPQEFALPAQPNDVLDLVLAPALTPVSQVVSAASRVEERILQAPVTIEKIDFAAVQRLPSPDLGRGLAQLKGIDVSSGGLLTSSLSTRGFNAPTSERLLQLSDYFDTQLPSLSTSIGNLLLGTPELDVESVEIIQGPASALYGANAFNGVVQLTSQDPFVRQGLRARVRGGERGLVDAQVRVARQLGQRVAFKLVTSYVTGREYEATNYAATSALINPVNNPAGSALGYDAVNRYGASFLTITPAVGQVFPGGVNPELYGKTIYQRGFTEAELLQNDTRSRAVRVLPSLAFLLSQDVKLTLGANLSWADATYQGFSSRYRLQNFSAQQYRAEVLGKRWFVRASSTHDNGGESYNLNFLGNYLQNGIAQPAMGPVPDLSYANLFAGTFIGAYGALRDSRNPGALPPDQALAAAAQAAHGTELVAGSPAFTALRNQIVADATPGRGARFNPNSLRHDLNGQYELPLAAKTNLVLGAAYRQYRLGSPNNNLFAQADGQRLTNYEYGGYAQLVQQLLPQDRLKLAGAVRVDEFKNFTAAVSPRVSATYSAGAKLAHNFRLSYGRAFRSPTQLDQYAHLELSPVLQLGNIGRGYQGYFVALGQFDANGNPLLSLATVDPLRLERVSTYEAGYKGVLTSKLFVDLNYYRSTYNDFIGTYRFVGNTDGSRPTEQELGALRVNNPGPEQRTRILQVQANADQQVRTQGLTAGLSYALTPGLTLSGNYSLSLLDRSNLAANFQTFYNTPRHKYNLAASGTVARHLSYTLNYRWAEGHFYETSFAAGELPAYRAVDAYLGYALQGLGTTVQLGGSNLFDTQNQPVYGGPNLGRLLYAGLLVEVK